MVFLLEASIHDYASPHVATDLVLFRVKPASTNPAKPVLNERTLQVLLAKRKWAPFVGVWALPGGFVGYTEELEATLLRKVQQKTGVENIGYLEQLRTYDAMNRDDRGRVVTVAYLGLLYAGTAEDSIRDGFTWYESELSDTACWFDVDAVLADGFELAFDHKRILLDALDRLRVKMQYTDILTHLLPKKFTLSVYQDVFEKVLGRGVQNFRRWVKPFVKSAGMFDADVKLNFRTPELFTRVSDSELIVFK